MVLFREAFHCSHEGLNLSLQCGGSWQLVSSTVVGGGHRANEYHATLVSEKRLVWLNNHHFPQMEPTDEAVNLTSELHDPNARVNHLRKKKKEKDLAESIGVVLAEYPPKVKLELFLQL